MTFSRLRAGAKI